MKFNHKGNFNLGDQWWGQASDCPPPIAMPMDQGNVVYKNGRSPDKESDCRYSRGSGSVQISWKQVKVKG